MNDECNLPVDIPVTKKQIENCIFSHWYGKFKGHTPRAEIIKPLPISFIKYLEQDGIKLPMDKMENSYYNQDLELTVDNDYSDWEDAKDERDDDKHSTDGNESTIDPLSAFPELHEQLKKVIGKFKSVMPKLNWSAPKDATWILPNNSMRCSEVNDVYLLLNASNYIMYDLHHAFEECIAEEGGNHAGSVEYELILREWFNINPALEFRVFIRDGMILGVSQRDLNYYDYLATLKEKLKGSIKKFVYEVLLPRIQDQAIVVDLYIPRAFDKVWLIDMNPFSRRTDSLMFGWNELHNTHRVDGSDFELRLMTEHNIGRFATKEHSEHHVPTDILEASLNTETLRELTSKWKELLSLQEDEES
ncbi:cell proliferation protein CDC123 Ecym_8069 [Eremothecium cymbalariae DBVPG|uniref:Translation initiation factor eIF2 assembly protein n=1 Tax=Eremothecium cymbalariae (strain CBS 270.75 / DBVPG 7215 / KCTC 17166 / NRRL Y-17582) TaxID=931890 RepID=G8JWZ1_ERECY|nr:Hypothetical protein Ecym_8069 [Eremothecium cymbalariae DBVPG\